MQRETLAIWRKSLGSEHPLVAQSLRELGLLVNKRNNLPEAEAMLRESLAIARKLPVNEYVDTATVLADLAKVLTAEGKSSEAGADPRRTKQVIKHSNSTNHSTRPNYENKPNMKRSADSYVAQVSNLPYRRFPIGRALDVRERIGLEIRDTDRQDVCATIRATDAE